jgi:hypothetical protein
MNTNQPQTKPTEGMVTLTQVIYALHSFSAMTELGSKSIYPIT